MPEHGDFLWNELMAKDLEGSKAFYNQVLGWEFSEMDVGTGPYTLISGGEMPRGGMMPMQGPEFENVPSHWMAYVQVDDVDATAAKVAGAGEPCCSRPSMCPRWGGSR